MTRERSRRSGEDFARREALGRAIAALRSERGLKRPDLAEATGAVSYTHLSEIENGKKGASGRTLEAIASALGVRPHEIMARADAILEGDLDRVEAESPGTRAFPGDRMAASSRLRRAEAASSWFHQQTAPAPPTADMSTTSSGPLDAISELVAVARTLPAEDIERLLDLARRLGART